MPKMSAVALAWALASSLRRHGRASQDAFQAAANAMRAELDDRFIVERAGAFVVAASFRAPVSTSSSSTPSRLRRRALEGLLPQEARRADPRVLFADKPSYEKWVKKLAASRRAAPTASTCANAGR